MELVVLTDEFDNEIGAIEKLKAHEEGLLHRAVSVFVFNSKQELLLQKRSYEKYHSGGLWTNTCCGHPRPGEKHLDAAKRRLAEEMGLYCDLEYLFKFTYNARLENQLTEYEVDHVYIGYTDNKPIINKFEADGYAYMDFEVIEKRMWLKPELFTAWFKIIFDRVKLEVRKKVCQ
jgi:isopentenyl-diphosphate delta-isomerase